jgi:hypothetical protein
MKRLVSELLLSAVETNPDLEKRLCIEAFLEELQRQLVAAVEEEKKAVPLAKTQRGALHALEQVLLRHNDVASWRRYVVYEVGRKSGILKALLEKVNLWLPQEGNTLKSNHAVRKAIDRSWDFVENIHYGGFPRFPLSKDEKNAITERLTVPALREFLVRLLWRGLYEHK